LTLRIVAISFCVITHLCGLGTVKAEEETSAELLIQTESSPDQVWPAPCKVHDPMLG
jgi:hypothetical protein